MEGHLLYAETSSESVRREGELGIADGVDCISAGICTQAEVARGPQYESHVEWANTVGWLWMYTEPPWSEQSLQSSAASRATPFDGPSVMRLAAWKKPQVTRTKEAESKYRWPWRFRAKNSRWYALLRPLDDHCWPAPHVDK